MRSAISLSALGAATASAPAYVVDLQSSPVTTAISAQICVGLMNRDLSRGGAYTLMHEPYDSQWLLDAEGISDPTLTDPDTFVTTCAADNSLVKGYIKYDYLTQQALVPNLVTLAAVMNALLLEEGHPATASLTLVYDAVQSWSGYDAVAATQYMYDNYVNNTSTLAWMNPGYDGHQNAADPPLSGSPNPKLIDFIVKEKVFNFYMNDACIPGTPDYELMTTMTAVNPWPRPIPVYGYDDTYPVAGDIFEAETGCTKNHNMGQIASDNVNNLSFFSRKDNVVTPLAQVTPEYHTFNSSKTYIMFVLGDGDNLSFLKSTRRDWMSSRVSRCEADPSYKGCFPLSWSISPQALHLAPDWLDWFYGKSYETGHDRFVLPPSGDLYSYPAEMPPDVMANYVLNTERDCQLLSTSGTVEWEWIGHWNAAVQNYYPRYSENNIVKGIFAVNVPYNLPIPTIFTPGEYYRLISGNVALFKPREWRGTEFPSNVPLSKHNFLSVPEMATEINNLPLGSVTWIYVTSDGGGGLDMLYDLVAILDEHVLVVDNEAVADLAFQRG